MIEILFENMRLECKIFLALFLKLANLFEPFFLIIDILRFSQINLKMESDNTLRGELTPYNIVPLDAPSMSNTIGFFPEVSFVLIFHHLIG